MQPAKRHDVKTRSPENETPVQLSDGATPGLASPAAQLQDQLYHAFEQAESGEKWSYRRTAACLILTCGAFWGSVVWLAGALI